MRLRGYCLLLAAAVAGTTVQSARAEDKMVYAAGASGKFLNSPGIPNCFTSSVANGDPEKGASVLLGKATAGCKVPWHWHTPNEQVMLVSGRGKIEMKDSKPMMVRSGDYLSLPAKQPHQFTCLAACTMFLIADSAFDMHYIDANGNEIPSEEALKGQAKAATKAPPKTQQ